MAEAQTGWAERSARLEHERVVASRGRMRVGERPKLATIANLEELEDQRRFVAAGADIDGVSHGQTMRAAINDLQHRLLLIDPQADVYELALERLMTAAGADRACAFLNRTDCDVREEYAIHAEAVVSPEWSLIASSVGETAAHEDFAPGLFKRLAAGEPFGSRTEFLPGRTAARLTAQGVEATLLLPLFVGGVFRGFLRLDRCDRTRLWSEGETGILVSAASSISAAIERQQVVAKLVQRSHELAALLTTSRAITSSIDYDVVLQEVACAAAEALVCPESAIWEYSGRSDVATYRVCYQRDPKSGAAESLVGTTYYASDYPGGMLAVRDRMVADQSLSDKDLRPEDRTRMTERGEKTRLSVPLVYSDEVLGMMILVETERERRFTPDEIRMARVIGEQAAAALHNARLHRREEDQHRWLAALAEATRVIGSRLHRVELLRDVAGLATTALLVDRALVYEWDERGAAFILRAADGEAAKTDDHAGAHAAIEATVTAALRDGDSVIQQRTDEDLAPEAAAHMEEAGEQIIVWVPFRMKDETLGAMRLSECSPDRRFAEGELSFARALGEHAAIALNNARLYAQIEDLAMRDGLTGLANHRCFYDRLAEEIERGRRYGTPVALLMLDIDDFKALNDARGHPAGDEVLRLIGGIMMQELRTGGDLAARYGGEEFCVILPNTHARAPRAGRSDASPDEAGCDDVERDADDAQALDGHSEGAEALAERLRRRIAACDFGTGPDHDPVRVTVSIGVSSCPGTADGMDSLVARADGALYAAKRAGKDRVKVY
jgi:GGDEF domain-containing protein